MATPTRKQVQVDVISAIVINRIANPPMVTIQVSPATPVLDGATPRLNAIGAPLHSESGVPYIIEVRAEGAGLARMGALIAGAEQRIRDGMGIDEALSAEAEELKVDLETAWDTGTDSDVEALGNAFGVQIYGAHTFYR